MLYKHMLFPLILVSLFLTPATTVATNNFENYMWMSSFTTTNNEVATSTSKVTNTSTFSEYTYSINFMKNFINGPSVVLGIITMEMKNATNTFWFYHRVGLVYSTSYDHVYQISRQFNGVPEMRIRWFAVDQTNMPFFITGFYNVNLATSFANSAVGSRTKFINYPSVLALNFAPMDTYVIHVYISGLKIAQTPNSSLTGSYYLDISATNTSLTAFGLNAKTDGMTQVSTLEYYHLFIDKTYIEANRWYKLEYGFVNGTASVQTTWPASTVNPIFMFAGLVKFAYQNITNSNLNFQFFTPYNIVSKEGYLDLSFAYWSLRKLTCNYTCVACGSGPQNCTSCPSTRDFSNWTCICKNGYFDNGTKNCAQCSSACLTCSVTPTNCTSCSSGVNFINNTCVCLGNLFYNGSTCLACDYTCETCAISATNCTSCNILHNRLESANSCPCISGYFDAGVGSCQVCTIANCQTCASATICQNCSSSYQVNSTGQCECGPGYYSTGGSCESCGSLGCLQCTSAGTCITCDSSNGFELNTTSASCVCAAGYRFLTTTKSCSNCLNYCLACSSPSNCTQCQTPETTLLNEVCVCSQGYFDNSGVCQLCDPNCLTCSGTSSNCTSCDISILTFVNNQCVCTQGQYYAAPACQQCHMSCTSCTAGGNADCTSCPSGLTPSSASLATFSCLCLTPETYYDGTSCSACDKSCSNCSGPTSTDCLSCPSGTSLVSGSCLTGCFPACSARYQCNISTSTCIQLMSLRLLSTVKLLTSNTLRLTIQISPQSTSAESLGSLPNLFSTNLPNLSFAYTNGLLTIESNYNSSLQNSEVSIMPRASGSLLWSSDSNLNFTVDPDNNVNANYYEQGMYSSVKTMETLSAALMYVSLLVFGVSLVSSKFIGVEMLGVIQVAYIGLMVIDYFPPVLAPLSEIGFVNGVNNFFNQNKYDLDLQAIPKRISSLDYASDMIYSLNYTIIILVLPLLVALALFIASKINKTNPKKLVKLSLTVLCQYGLTAVMFILYHMTVSVALYIGYSKTSSTLFPVSLVECLISLSIVIAIAVLFKLKPQYFGDYRKQFRQPLICQYYYWILMGGRILLASILVGMNAMSAGAFVAMIVPAADLAILLSSRPYKHMYNNYRAIFNQIILLTVLGMYGYYRLAQVPDISTLNQALPFTQISLLYLCVIVNLLTIIKFTYEKWTARTRKQSIAKVQQTEQETKAEFKQQTRQRMRTFTTTISAMNHLRGSTRQFQPQNVSIPKEDTEYQSPVNLNFSGFKQQLKDKLLVERKISENIIVETHQFGEEEIKEIEMNFDAI